jgi:DNA polymerase Pol2
MNDLLNGIDRSDDVEEKPHVGQFRGQSFAPVPTKRGLHPNTLLSRNPTRAMEVPECKKEESPEAYDDYAIDIEDMLSPTPTSQVENVSENFDIDQELHIQALPTTEAKDDDAMEEEEDAMPLKIKPLQTKARDVKAPSVLVNATSKREIARPAPAPPAPVVAAPSGDLQGWESVKMNDAKASDDVVISAAPDKLNVLESDGSLRMWWFDAYERREKGQVYLFGKALNKATNQYVSCCVTVKNIQRSIFVLPRPYKVDKTGLATDEEVDQQAVFEEMESIRSRSRINKWACKPVTRKYAFEEQNVPQEAEYLKIKYSFEQPQLPQNLSGTTFSHAFGINTNPLELLLIKRDIMGPCWLDVKNPTIASANETWCKIQAVIEDPKFCNTLKDASGNAPKEVPPLVIMSLSLRTVMNHQKRVNEIVAASAMVCKHVMIDEPTPIEKQLKTVFNVVRQLNGVPYPAGLNDLINKERQKGNVIHIEKTELALLNLLIAKLHMHDPDVIVGHNFAGFDLDILLHRMKALNTQHWHKLGRLKRSKYVDILVRWINIEDNANISTFSYQLAKVTNWCRWLRRIHLSGTYDYERSFDL